MRRLLVSVACLAAVLVAPSAAFAPGPEVARRRPATTDATHDQSDAGTSVRLSAITYEVFRDHGCSTSHDVPDAIPGRSDPSAPAHTDGVSATPTHAVADEGIGTATGSRPTMGLPGPADSGSRSTSTLDATPPVISARRHARSGTAARRSPSERDGNRQLRPVTMTADGRASVYACRHARLLASVRPMRPVNTTVDCHRLPPATSPTDRPCGNLARTRRARPRPVLEVDTDPASRRRR